MQIRNSSLKQPSHRKQTRIIKGSPGKPYCQGDKVSNRFQCGGWNGGACGGESELEGGKRWWHDLELEVTHGLSLLSAMSPFWVFFVTQQVSE
ncbi:hypothetical protein NC651_019012 [Populus alba x Populus x berolinensis]|nr:hypothetical protein NC651_019012 [Populus alba x Populus x berolinensis]